MKLVILDRDGVINYDSPYYIKNPEEWIPIPKSLEAIAQLNRAGFHVAVATNQSGVGRGFYSQATLALIHQKMQDTLSPLGGRVDHFFYCPHLPEEHCNCRKPKPGLLQAVSEHYGIELMGVPAIGDSLRDIQAAQAVGCRPILVLTGNGEKTLKENPALEHEISIFKDLAAAAEELIL